MTSAPTIQMSAAAVTAVEDPRRVLRLRLKPKAAATGFVDGGWWPRSRDLAVELPGLLAVLAVRLGRIERVSYHLGDWDPIPARLSFDGGVVRLGGYRAQHADTVDVLAARQRVTLLVVPPQTSSQTAHEALMSAGHRGNTDDVEALLKSRRFARRIVRRAGRDAAAEDEAEAALQRWELDGGHLYARREGLAD
jgi:Family of unknown function (DUF5994)